MRTCLQPPHSDSDSPKSGKVLPNENSILHKEIFNLKQISDAREMVLNPDKTKLLICNFSDSNQFQTLLTIPGATSNIELCFQTKILGYWLTSDVKPDKHVAHILRIAYSRLWAISRLKTAKVSDDDILLFYTMNIRSVL